MSRPNILLIMADQFRRDALYHNGGFGRTDTLDALARGGVSFRKAVTNAPECIPARFALATGLYPHQTGVWRNAPITLSPSAPTWMTALVKAGYRTSVFGKTHFHENAQPSGDIRDGQKLMENYGLMDVDEIAGPRASMRILSTMTEEWDRLGLWDAYREDFQSRFASRPCIAKPSPLGFEHYYDTYVGRTACNYLANYDRAEPWFCWVSFAGPHEPWDAPQPYDTMHPPVTMPASLGRIEGVDSGLLGELFASGAHDAPRDAAEIAHLRANYAGNVTLIDDQIGTIFETLRSRGSYDETLIIFTSDHGEMNGDHGLVYKGNFLASAVDIPMIVRPPTSERAQLPHASDALVELIDVGATIVDYARATDLPSSNGRSLRPVIEGRTSSHRNYVVSEYAGHSMIRIRDWKCEFDQQDRLNLLIDMRGDPDEKHNLATGRVHEARDTLRKLLTLHREATAHSESIVM